jgi:hypothetical protein
MVCDAVCVCSVHESVTCSTNMYVFYVQSHEFAQSSDGNVRAHYSLFVHTVAAVILEVLYFVQALASIECCYHSQ